MAWIALAILGFILIIALLILSAAMDEARYRHEIWDEFHHPPDSEVDLDEHD